MAGMAAAQSFPQKIVRIVVPFPAGSGGDIVARIYTPRLAEATGQQFLVENRAGAAGNIGAEPVAIGQDHVIRSRLLSHGAEPQAETPEQVRAFIASEVVKWGKVIAVTGVRGE